MEMSAQDEARASGAVALKLRWDYPYDVGRWDIKVVARLTTIVAKVFQFKKISFDRWFSEFSSEMS